MQAASLFVHHLTEIMKKARFYLLNDSVNLLLINKWQQDFDKLDRDTRQSYREASIMQSILSRLMIP